MVFSQRSGLEDRLGSTLDRHPVRGRDPVDGGHHLEVRIERVLGVFRCAFEQRRALDALVSGGPKQRNLHRITDVLALLGKLRVVAQDDRFQRSQACARRSAHVQRFDRHPVLGERACLVGAQNARGPERFDGGEAIDQRPVPRHPVHAASECNRRDDG